MPTDLAALPIIARQSDMHEDRARWSMVHEEAPSQRVDLEARLVTSDLQIQLEGAGGGLGVALMPEPLVAAFIEDGNLVRVLPDWFTPEYSVFLIYPTPRGMLPSVRSFIDFVLANMTVSPEEPAGQPKGG